MKRFFIAALAAASMMAASADNRDWGNFGRYAQSNEEVKAAPASERKVVFMGNSITEGWVNAHPEFFKKNGFVGRGISGQTSFQYLVRFRSDVVNLHPEVVVINAGTNDVAENTQTYNEDLTMDNIMSMVELAQAAGIKVILASTLPAAAFGWNPSITDAAAKISSLNARVAKYAAEKGIPFVDYYSAMVTSDGKGALRSDLSGDGVHPTPQGYDVMEAIVLPVIAKTLSTK